MKNDNISKKLIGCCLILSSNLLYAESSGLIGMIDQVAQSTGQMAKNVVHETGKVFHHSSQSKNQSKHNYQQVSNKKYKQIAKKNNVNVAKKPSITSVNNQKLAQTQSLGATQPSTPQTTENFVIPNDAQNTSTTSTQPSMDSNSGTTNTSNTQDNTTQNSNTLPTETQNSATSTSSNTSPDNASSSNSNGQSQQDSTNSQNSSSVPVTQSNDAPAPTTGPMPEVSDPMQNNDTNNTNTQKQNYLPDLSDPETTAVPDTTTPSN